MSIDAALDVAHSLQLAGVVLDAAALRKQPEAAVRAARLGQRVLTYGIDNNDPDWFRQQRAMGVHAVIVDDVGGLLAALRAGGAQEAPPHGAAALA